MKIHLGCGERYLEGYENIDFPSTEHTVQKTSVADKYADIVELKYEKSSIDEIRLHHVFEHFERAQAAALVAVWNNWLKDGGILHIEVPDFFRTAIACISPFTTHHKRMVGIRHIFGSQEAKWAVHFDGYDSFRLKKMLKIFGFEIIKIKKNSWRGTYNIEIIARKTNKNFSKEDCLNAGRIYLRQFCVDQSETEKIMLESWMKNFKSQLDKNY
ncbi:MAG: Methylase involved in ubiquinone/menaquinone biosynthesis-like protein [Candidatus Moranbacteria bacterium GW2011_GWD2_36_12]|nr:MAG: Methylase involved in ubiquinone/menaquinone biosynthesis-like protein [Candidatus Moranbacteria bacterium GW2011_GWD2_36_12]KKQ05809.1 MAG: Methylase involved in ubiquinone/menaquinone biosynthesis-like protein [Candidatus Moranbacteria bacterium GW2011_GWE2_36_40]